MLKDDIYGLKLTLKADTCRTFGKFSWQHLVKGVLTRRSFRPVISMRLCQAANCQSGLTRFLLLPMCKLLHHLSCQAAGMDIPWSTSIAPGLALTHGWGLVISPEAVIGCNVTLFHGVTLGRRDRIAKDGSRDIGYPVIEDEVWIGPHAIVVGGVTIGRGSRIAGGAYIYESVPPFSIVAGNPSSIIKTGCTPDVPNRADTTI